MNSLEDKYPLLISWLQASEFRCDLEGTYWETGYSALGGAFVSLSEEKLSIRIGGRGFPDFSVARFTNENDAISYLRSGEWKNVPKQEPYTPLRTTTDYDLY